MSGWDAAVAVGAVVGQLLTEIARGMWAVTKVLGWVLLVTLAVLFCWTTFGRRLEYRTRPE